MRAASSPRLAALDYLRLVAALGVVAYHWLFWGPEHGEIPSPGAPALSAVAAYGFLGVELFFLISGFVIFWSANSRDAASFAAGRATRLYPAFWAGVLLTTATLLVTGQAHLPEVVPRVLANLTMVPAAFGQAQLDGVYWTLTLELEFYAVVFLFLLVGRRRWLEPFFAVWAIVMLITNLLSPGLAAIPLLGGLFSLFAGGAIIAAIGRTGWTPLNAIGLAASVLSSVVATIHHTESGDDPLSTDPLVVSAVVVALFALVFFLTRPRAGRLRLPGSRTAGALTYPIYLCHAVFGYALLNTIDIPGGWGRYALAFAIVLAVAAGVHFGVERAAGPFWRRLFHVLLAVPIGRLPRRAGGVTDAR